MFPTPILLIIYNRPDYTKCLIDVLKEIKPTTLFIASDGPKNEKDKILTDETKKIIEQIDWKCEKITLYQEKNLGCGLGVSTAISWFFQQVEYGIILEDDCIPEYSFFPFCELLLEKYKYNDDIMMIGGSSWFSEDANLNYPYDYFFANIRPVWGWASWRRAWNKYVFKISEEMLDNALNKRVWKDMSNKKLLNFRQELLKSTYLKQTDTWDIQWDYCVSINKGKTIIPIKNQISNIGIQGTNYSKKSTLTELTTYQINITELKHPPSTTIIAALDKTYQNIEAKKFLSMNEPVLRFVINKSKYYILQFLILLGIKKRKNENTAY